MLLYKIPLIPNPPSLSLPFPSISHLLSLTIPLFPLEAIHSHNLQTPTHHSTHSGARGPQDEGRSSIKVNWKITIKLKSRKF